VVIHRSALYKTLYLLLFSFLGVNSVIAQLPLPLDKQVSFTSENKKVSEILKIIYNQTKINFNYKSGILPKQPLTIFTAENEKLSDVLLRLLKPYNIEYKYFGGNSIVLKPIKNISNHQFTISGYVFDKSTGEKLIGASIYCNKNKRGTHTNDYGFFTISLPEDSIDLEIRFVGYTKFKEQGLNKGNSFRIFNLLPKTNLKEIEINDERQAKSEQRPNGFYLNLKAIKDIPTFMGEPDVIRAVQMLPGVQGAGESAGGINVRGGGTDQNLVLLDGVPVYNIVHVFGLFSIINPGSVNSVEIIKGGFSAKHNGRLASIFDIRLKDGNNQKLAANISLGMLLSSITLEGPLIKNKSSFIISYRRTYFDLFTQPIQYFSNRKDLNNYSGWYYFYDLNSKINYKLGNRDKLSLNFFTGSDRGRITETQNFTDMSEILQKRNHNKNLRWFTLMSSLRWDHILNDKIFMVTTAGITRYSTKFEDQLFWETKPNPEIKTSSLNYKQTSGNSDIFLKTIFEIKAYKKHDITVGADLIYHQFNTGTLNYNTVENTTEKDTSIGDRNIFSHEQVLFAEDKWQVSKKLQLNLGLSFNSITVKQNNYQLLQPRISGNYQFSKAFYTNISYSRMQQNLQILPNNSVGLPIDIWIPVTDYLKPQISDQITAGMGYYFKKHYKLSIETYYKAMQNLVELKEGSFFVFGGYEWDKSFYTGKGNAKGIEIMLEKQVGKMRGWISYTLSKSDRNFAGINQGKSFPFKYDRRHQITAFLKMNLNKTWNFSLSWIFTSGSPVTIPTSVYTLNNKSYYEFTERNNIRMSNYHRMDLSFTKTILLQKSKRTWNIGAYNLYSHVNPMFISSSYIVTNSSTRLKFYEVGLIPLIPFVSYEISF